MVIIEFFSVGMLSYFYKDMITEDKKAIAMNLYRTSPVQLESWLRCLTDLRNRCAHYSRIYYWPFPAMPKMPNDYDYIADRKLFSQLLMLKFLYPDNKKWGSKFVSALKALIEEYKKDISLKHIGFPDDWEERIRNILTRNPG
ncbi:Abi family protein [Clostridium algidicarnis]|nr:Abi family protein [Clostridium algidicarnis]